MLLESVPEIASALSLRLISVKSLRIQVASVLMTKNAREADTALNGVIAKVTLTVRDSKR